MARISALGKESFKLPWSQIIEMRQLKLFVVQYLDYLTLASDGSCSAHKKLGFFNVKPQFPVQLTIVKFLSRIKVHFWGSAVSMILALYKKMSPFILDRNLAKANWTGNRVCTSCDIVVLAWNLFGILKYSIERRGGSSK